MEVEDNFITICNENHHWNLELTWEALASVDSPLKISKVISRFKISQHVNNQVLAGSKILKSKRNTHNDGLSKKMKLLFVVNDNFPVPDTKFSKIFKR